MKNESQYLVSIICDVFNHKPFLRNCLEGFVNQVVDFKFEVLIHDDASTDGSQEIIEEYEQKYPTIFKPIYQRQNQYSQGIRIWPNYQFPRAQGKYIALCEGDDYWTDPNKLQKQVDFLEANPDYSLCFHNAMESWEDAPHKNRLFAKIDNRDYSAKEIYNRWIVPTASALFKKEVIDSELYLNHIAFNPQIYFGDIALFTSCAQFGKVHALAETMSVYRRHGGGVTNQIACLNIQFIYCSQGFEMASIFSANKELASLMVDKSIKRTLQMYWTTFFLSDKEYRLKCSKLIKENAKGHLLLILFQSPVRFYMALRSYLKNKKKKH